MDTRTPTHGSELVATTAELLGRLRAGTPLVQVITNAVVTNFTANVLLALGASPAMVDLPGEAGVFAGIADGLLVNLGTPHAEQREASVAAARAAGAGTTPWVLDPVAIGALPVRTALAHELAALAPTVIRGNASEIAALAHSGAGGRGVDAVELPESALSAAFQLATAHGSVVAISGATDIVTDGVRVARISNGHPWLTKVTGGGCALGAVLAAFVAVHSDPFEATVAGVTAYTVAAQLAAEHAAGPGSFAAGLLDQLERLTPADVHRLAVIA